jgi:mitochondrial fission protein ELM1
MISDRPGDNAQALAVARATGLPFEVKPMIPIGGSIVHKGTRSHAPDRLDPDDTARLEPPWPDLIITIGGWATPASLWVQERSGGRTRIVLIGRPKRRELDRFALVLVSSQYRVPAHPIVVKLDFPVARPDHAQIAEMAARWRPLLDPLARPLTAVLVGGRTKPYRLDEAVARTLAADLKGLLARDGGFFYVVTSRRTDPQVSRALARDLPAAAKLFDWQSDARADNPYLGLLGCADRFVVTADSISMMTDVASLGRPLAIYPLPKESRLRHRLSAARAWLIDGPAARVGRFDTLALLAHRLGLAGFPRDLEAVHRRLYDRGRAAPFGAPFPAAGPGLDDELAGVAARIRTLLPGSSRPDPTAPDGAPSQFLHNAW